LNHEGTKGTTGTKKGGGTPPETADLTSGDAPGRSNSRTAYATKSPRAPEGGTKVDGGRVREGGRRKRWGP
jgi:hypothetical protein